MIGRVALLTVGLLLLGCVSADSWTHGKPLVTPPPPGGALVTDSGFSPPNDPLTTIAGDPLITSGSAPLVKIMPLGDSITQGQDTTFGSYRRLLYNRLITGGINVDFVGVYSNGMFPEPQHYGVTGDVVNGTWGLVASGMIIETYAPDIILLMIGTNDVWLYEPNDAVTLATYSNLLDSIATHGPNVKTIVASILPIGVSTMGSVSTFNSGLATLVATKGSNFIFVNVNAGMTLADLADGVHPTDDGNDKLARLWFPALRTVLGF